MNYETVETIPEVHAFSGSIPHMLLIVCQKLSGIIGVQNQLRIKSRPVHAFSGSTSSHFVHCMLEIIRNHWNAKSAENEMQTPLGFRAFHAVLSVDLCHIIPEYRR